jgi:hypothetical protein
MLAASRGGVRKVSRLVVNRSRAGRPRGRPAGLFFSFVLLTATLTSCGGAVVGDPTILAYEGNSTALRAVMFLACPGEHVRELTVRRDLSSDGVQRPGPVLTKLTATGESAEATFAIGSAPTGFVLAVPPSGLVAGPLDVEVRTNGNTYSGFIDTAELTRDEFRVAGGAALSPALKRSILATRCGHRKR